MADLKNTFSWSFSAASDFEECRRKRYWAKYGMWGGWERHATAEQKKAYQLCKMENAYSLQGAAVEEAVMWALRKGQAGQAVTAEEAYTAAARPYLNQAWKESKDKSWQASPKKYCCLREHYYGEWDAAAEKEKTATIIENTKRCIVNFVERVWPRLAKVRPEMEVQVAGPGGGDPENFELEGIKIYAIPDYVYRLDGLLHIHDWKSGKAKEEHLDQVGIYGLWAHLKLGVPPETILVYIEYLSEGKVAPGQLDEQVLEGIRAKIGASVADMTDYLVDGDRQRNEPRPREEWDLTDNRRTCSRCNFYELCKPELEALL